MNMQVEDALRNSRDPSVRFLFLRDVAGEDPGSSAMIALQEEIRRSDNAQKLLEKRDSDGKFPWGAYAKWRGAFWVLLQLVDLGYPAGDQNLAPLRDQVLDWLLDEDRLKRIPLIDGRYRRCALQEATAVLTMIRLNLLDARIEHLVELLLKWQWPDGGWNCDKKAKATHSSFYETWLPLRAMHAYGQLSGDLRVKVSTERASEVFLSRHLYKRLHDGETISDCFTQLAFPAYWHYDILVGLMLMHEIGKLEDSRCKDALDLLDSKRLEQGGFAADVKYYTVTDRRTSGVTSVNWGPVGKTKMNEHVTVRALGVLKHAGRLL